MSVANAEDEVEAAARSGSDAPGSQAPGDPEIARRTADLDLAFAQMSDGAKLVIRVAESLRRLEGSPDVVTSQLLFALVSTNSRVQKRVLGSVSEDRFRKLLRNVPRSVPLDPPPTPSEIDAMPPLSEHTADAVLAARSIQLRDRRPQLVGTDLFAGLLGLEQCSQARHLRELGVQPDTPAPLAPFSVHAAAQADQPTDKDLIGYQKIVDSLADLLTGTSTTFPLTLAIAAPWGGGKSSVMKMLKGGLDRTRGQRWLTVEFPAWRFESGEQVWAGMAKATYHAALAQRNWLSRIWFRTSLNIRRGNVLGLLGRLGSIVAPGIAGWLLAPVVTAAVAPGAAATDTSLVGGAAGATLGAGGVWNVLGDSFKKAVESFADNPRLEHGDGYTADAAKQVDALIEHLLDGGRRVAIFIDDLDRCTPRNLVRVIEAVNQIFIAGSELATRPNRVSRWERVRRRLGRPPVDPPAPRLVFVMGMDRRVVARGIETEYGNLLRRMRQAGDEGHMDYGVSFLDKIVQLWVTLPRPSSDEMVRLLGNVAGMAPTGSRAGSEAVAAESDRLRRHLTELGANGDTRANRIAIVKQLTRSSDPELAGALIEASQAFLAEASAPDPTDDPGVWNAMKQGLGCLDANPRQIKRFSNAFRLQLNVAARSELIDFTPDVLEALARWVAIRLRWADLAGRIDEHPDLLEDLETLATGTDPAPRNGAVYAPWQIKDLGSAPIADVDELKAALKPMGTVAISKLPFSVFLPIS